MPNLRDIQRRIKSVGSTSQITKAMQLVASAKMRRAQEQALAGRNYIGALAYVFDHLKDQVDKNDYAVLNPGKGDRELVLAISTDKGLCGAMNTNLYKLIKSEVSADAHFITIGRKLNSILNKTRHRILEHYTVGDPVPLLDLKPVLISIVDKFRSGEYSKVTIIFTQYVNTLVQKPAAKQFIPITEEQLDELSANSATQRKDNTFEDFTLDPGADQVMSAILPLFLFYDLLQKVLEARASEHSARMVSMKTATENAQDLIKDLTLAYNKARQTAITSELTEISSAMKAME